jgi:ADP-ribosyl-[dinitrogen reductase] hydrolase
MVGTLAGCAIGDALGNPFEMKHADYLLLKEWDGLFKDGGTFWEGNAGQYTDDTLMSIALSNSLINCKGFDPDDVAQEYLNWYNTGNTRGIGTTTARAIHNLKDGASFNESGIVRGYDDLPASGNGTAMRAAPIGLVYYNNLNKLVEVAMLDASITHNSLEPKIGSVSVALAVALLVKGDSDKKNIISDILSVLTDSEVTNKLKLAKLFIKYKTDPMEALASIGVSGYVPETVGAAFYCFAATNSFQDAVVMAVKAGGDTDTTAAITGALAGTFYGLDGIPEHYRSVEDYNLLNKLTIDLINIEL